MQETLVQALGWEDPLKEGTHSSTVVWRIPWKEDPGRLQSIGSHKSDMAEATKQQQQQAVSHQAPRSIRFSSQECWSVLPFPYPGDLSDPGIKPTSPTLASEFFTIESPGKPIMVNTCHYTFVQSHRMYNTKSVPYGL